MKRNPINHPLNNLETQVIQKQQIRTIKEKIRGKGRENNKLKSDETPLKKIEKKLIKSAIKTPP